MKRESRFLLDDIIEAIKSIKEYSKDMDFEKFSNNKLVFDAVCRNLEIIGEASSNLDDKYKEDYPNINWKKVKDFRNVIAHQYFKIDKNIIWDIIKNKIPELEGNLL